MNTGGGARAWPFPGLVWGDYPQRQLPIAAGPRPAAWSRRRLERFARAWREPGRASEDDAQSLALLRACAAFEAERGIALRWQQVMAARALLDERLVEMDTGEGKTFAIALAAAAAALGGTPVHVVTANDYLAARDAQELAGFHARLGLTTGCAAEGLPPLRKRAAYACDVTYVTGKELVFDWLRDALRRPPAGSALEQRLRRGEEAGPVVLRGLCFAILDEADTLLIDEARVPLVLAQQHATPGERAFHAAAWALAQALREGVDFRVAADGARVRLLPAGRAQLERWPDGGTALHAHPAHREQALLQALTARHVLKRDRDYLVRDGRIELVDGASGRAARGRAWSQGLHQLVELKESIAATTPNDTLAQVTYQRFFPRYHRLAGTSGTLREARRELREVYGLSLVCVPPHEPRQVRSLPPRLFGSSAALWAQAAGRAAGLARAGRPVLIGVGSVEEARSLTGELAKAGVPFQLLDAAHDAHEREVLAAAGHAGCITVATSMAGRGSDIRPDAVALAAGGLHVILCQASASARIDRQFLGRAGRQGEPGSTEHWVAADFEALAQRWPKPLLEAMARRFPRGHGVALLLALTQLARAYTETQQRVTLRRASEAEERDLGFARDRVI